MKADAGKLYTLPSRVQFGKLSNLSSPSPRFYSPICCILEHPPKPIDIPQIIHLCTILSQHSKTNASSPAGWTEEDTKSYTGPTLGVVTKLAENVRPKLNSTYTICESGTAGPTGGTTKNRTP
jgi:hypothetical protein